MKPELIFLLVTGLIAALLGLGALIAALRRNRAPRGDDAADLASLGDAPIDKYEADAAGTASVTGAAQGTAVRVLWWVSIASVLVGVGVTDAFESTRPAIYAIGAAAVAVAVLLHDLVPARYRTAPLVALEVLAAIGLTTALLPLTGYATSPFVFGYNLVAVAVALGLGGALALGVAALSTIAFLAVLAFDPEFGSYAGSDLLRFGLTLASIWLLAYLAGVYANSARRMHAQVLQLSRIDSLTGLLNRGQLFPTLEQEVQRTRRSERGFCLLMIDLDGLKAVNDSYGHHRGDEVLRMLGGVIRHSIRTVDTAYRYGGDEFLVLLPETDFAGAFVVAEKIRSGAEEVGLSAGGGELLTSVSIGLVSCPEDGTSAEELMIAADRAMYQAKSLGKNQVSGNPRPRRLTYRPGPGEAAAIPVMPDDLSHPTEAAAEAPAEAPTEAPPEARPTAERAATRAEEWADATLRAAAQEVAGPELEDGPTLPHESLEEEEPDASEVRRHIAAARRHMDPDHQIRRAMDAFLSPTRPGDRS